jgi:hypothetical protein
VDDVNSVLRRLLGMEGMTPSVRDHASAQPAGSAAGSVAAKGGAGSGRSTAEARSSRAKAKRRSARPRAARGSLLPEREYEEPLLRALAARGGSAPASEVIEDVGAALGGRLTDADREGLSSGLTRYKNRVQFVRLKLVQAGEVKKGSPRGVWEITPKGHERLKRLDSDD